MAKNSKGYVFLWFIVLFSLGLNAWLFWKFLNAENRLSNGAGDIVAALDKAQTESISYTAHIKQNVPVSASFDINETISVPIQTSIPINTSVAVPVTIPVIGQVTIPVPINTSVPINTTVSVPIKKTITIKGTSPVSVDIPVEIPIAQTALGDILSKLKMWISANARVSK